MEVNFWEYFIPGTIHYVFYFSIYLVIGKMLGECISKKNESKTIEEIFLSSDQVMKLGMISLVFMF